MEDNAYRVTFGDGSAMYITEESAEAAKTKASLYAWKVCDYFPTVVAVERVSGELAVLAAGGKAA